MGIKERKEKQKDSLRREIMNAARELFVEHGYDSVSMRKVADKIEYSPTTIYLYFKDKQDLLISICEETFAQLHHALENIENQGRDPLVCLKKGMRAYIEFGLNHPNDYTMVFITSPENYDAELAEEYKYEGSMGQRAFSHLVTMVTQCIQEGKIKKGDPDTISQTIWASLHGLTSLLIGHKDFPFVAREKLINSVINTMVKGLQN
jgi:AcrR family transcriptional regulator